LQAAGLSIFAASMSVRDILSNAQHLAKDSG